jgi:hypothetical protein
MVIHPRLNFIYIGIKGYHPHELPSFHSSRNVCTAPVFQLQGGGGAVRRLFLSTSPVSLSVVLPP